MYSRDPLRYLTCSCTVWSTDLCHSLIVALEAVSISIEAEVDLTDLADKVRANYVILPAAVLAGLPVQEEWDME